MADLAYIIISRPRLTNFETKYLFYCHAQHLAKINLDPKTQPGISMEQARRDAWLALRVQTGSWMLVNNTLIQTKWYTDLSLGTYTDLSLGTLHSSVIERHCLEE